jgi:sulfate transport system ATP-binding protein
MNKAHVEQVGTPQQVYDRPASPFVYQFLGNVNVLRAPALAGANRRGGRPDEANPDGQIYVRPHDIELTPHDAGGEGLSAIVRHIHAAGPHARLLLEQVQTREQVEVEISRSELSNLNLKANDLVRFRMRQTHSFDEDYAI